MIFNPICSSYNVVGSFVRLIYYLASCVDQHKLLLKARQRKNQQTRHAAISAANGLDVRDVMAVKLAANWSLTDNRASSFSLKAQQSHERYPPVKNVETLMMGVYAGFLAHGQRAVRRNVIRDRKNIHPSTALTETSQ